MKRDARDETVTGVRSTKLEIQRLTIHALTGPSAGKSQTFDHAARVGSRQFADFVVADPRVSGLHCEISIDGQMRVKDLGSKNGTFLGDHQIVEAFLRPNDNLRIGDTELRVLASDQRLEVALLDVDEFHGIIGCSPAIRALTAQLQRLARTNTTVLVLGESGTGKERVAEALHLAGPRADGPLVVVDCSALPTSLVESELFGHVRGAFTGAMSDSEGAFERANGGTLFLDEIGEMPVDVQPKLLRALESRSVRRLGSGKQCPVDVRVVAATNRDLQIEVAKGRFREDLYYRLAVVTIRVPPLRDRLVDIPLLAAHFAQTLGVSPAACLTPASLAQLSQHSWPGNVRELRNSIERAIALMEAPSVSREREAQPSAPVAGTALPARYDVPFAQGKRDVVLAYETEYVSRLLAECKGNISEVARRAQVDRLTIYRMLQRRTDRNRS